MLKHLVFIYVLYCDASVTTETCAAFQQQTKTADYN